VIHDAAGLAEVDTALPAGRWMPIGTVRIRTRHQRGGERRAWVKVAEPNVWRLRAQVVWEKANGPIPSGYGIHHRDRNKLNDALGNLELVSKAEHLEEHRGEFNTRIATLIDERRRRRWSTKSSIKRTGRHPRACECPLHGGAR